MVTAKEVGCSLSKHINRRLSGGKKLPKQQMNPIQEFQEFPQTDTSRTWRSGFAFVRPLLNQRCWAEWLEKRWKNQDMCLFARGGKARSQFPSGQDMIHEKRKLINYQGAPSAPEKMLLKSYSFSAWATPTSNFLVSHNSVRIPENSGERVAKSPKLFLD